MRASFTFTNLTAHKFAVGKGLKKNVFGGLTHEVSHGYTLEYVCNMLSSSLHWMSRKVWSKVWEGTNFTETASIQQQRHLMEANRGLHCRHSCLGQLGPRWLGWFLQAIIAHVIGPTDWSGLVFAWEWSLDLWLPEIYHPRSPQIQPSKETLMMVFKPNQLSNPPPTHQSYNHHVCLGWSGWHDHPKNFASLQISFLFHYPNPCNLKGVLGVQAVS